MKKIAFALLVSIVFVSCTMNVDETEDEPEQTNVPVTIEHPVIDIPQGAIPDLPAAIAWRPDSNSGK